MVQHPHGINTLSSGKVTLLPIDPPKVNSLVFERMVNLGEVCFEEFSISGIKQDGLGSATV